MSPEEKIAAFERIQKQLWDLAQEGNIGQSVFAAALIRQLEIPGPNGEDPDSA